MLLKAALDHYINLTKAFFVGDDERDREAGLAAGARVLMVSEDQNLLSIAQQLAAL